MKIQNTNEYGIKIKYYRRYLMLMSHTIEQKNVFITCNLFLATIALHGNREDEI
jgi:hypothetical protein